MHAAFIYRALSESETRELQQLNAKVLRHPTVAPPPGLEVDVFELSAAEKDRLSREVFPKVLAFGDLEVEGQSIARWLSYGKASDWYSHRFRIYFEQRAFAYAEHEIRLLQAQFDEIVVFHAFPGLERVGLGQNVRLVYGPQRKSERVSTRSVINYFLAFAGRALQGYLQKHRAKGKRHLILYRPTQEHTLLALDGKTLIRDDFLLGYMLQEAPSKFLLIEEFNAPLVGETYRLLRRHFGLRPKGRRYLNGEHVVFRGLLSRSVQRERRQIIANIHRDLDRMAAVVTDPFHQRIIQRLRGLDRTRKLYILRTLSYKRFFRSWNVDTITGTDENNAFTKPVLDAFKELGVKTIGVQHGTMGDMHPSFRFTSKDLALHPMPDLTIVWGEEWKRGLVEQGHYPVESVIVCGQQRTDLIPVLRHVRKSELIPGVDDERPMLVFASQPQPDKALRERAAFDVFRLIHKFPELQVALKLHPRERYDQAYYEEIARRAGSTNHHILFKVELYQLISACDLLVTCFSTVGSEAVYFRKPLIVLDYLNQDLLGYVKRGVAFHATRDSELESTVARILGGERCSPAMVEKYIQDFAYRIDGKARFRYLNAILDTGRS
jgi:hypothetical protein